MPQFSIGDRSGVFWGQSSGGIYCPMFFSSQVIVALDVCARAYIFLLKQSITIARKQLCRSQVSADLRAAECRLDFFLEYFTDVVIGIYRSFLWNDMKLC